MSFNTKSQAELNELFSLGASIEISVSGRSISDLSSLASYASVGGGQLILKGASALGQRDLESLAAYGNGHILFKD
ncbi:hypothetical protein ACX0KY_13635 [Pseudomonas extremorientalis]